ncbi:hypothetical protein OFB65_25270, partial [Escherichia coli]|nr:hypothetical protein [Escherichia coli]
TGTSPPARRAESCAQLLAPVLVALAAARPTTGPSTPCRATGTDCAPLPIWAVATRSLRRRWSP